MRMLQQLDPEQYLYEQLILGNSRRNLITLINNSYTTKKDKGAYWTSQPISTLFKSFAVKVTFTYNKEKTIGTEVVRVLGYDLLRIGYYNNSPQAKSFIKDLMKLELQGLNKSISIKEITSVEIDTSQSELTFMYTQLYETFIMNLFYEVINKEGIITLLIMNFKEIEVETHIAGHTEIHTDANPQNVLINTTPEPIQAVAKQMLDKQDNGEYVDIYIDEKYYALYPKRLKININNLYNYYIQQISIEEYNYIADLQTNYHQYGHNHYNKLLGNIVKI